MYLRCTLFYFASSFSAEVFTDFALPPVEAAKVGFQTKWGNADVLRDAASKKNKEGIRWFLMNEIDKYGPGWSCLLRIYYWNIVDICWLLSLEIMFKDRIGGCRIWSRFFNWSAIVFQPSDSVTSVVNKDSITQLLQKLGHKGWMALLGYHHDRDFDYVSSGIQKASPASLSYTTWDCSVWRGSMLSLRK